MKFKFVLLLLTFWALFLSGCKINKRNEENKLIIAAEKFAIEGYGVEVKKEFPLKIIDSTKYKWRITGSLPEGSDGGTVFMIINKADTSLAEITHGK